MLTIYWTVELDLRFCPQAIDGWMDLLTDGWMVVEEGGGKIKQPMTKSECTGRKSTSENLSV